MSNNMAILTDVYRDAKAKAEWVATGTGWQKWLVIAAAVIGGLMLLRGMRKIWNVAFGLFWIWFWTHGAWRWIL